MRRSQDAPSLALYLTEFGRDGRLWYMGSHTGKIGVID